MKTALIIGMGKFGHHLCHRLVSLGNQVMIVDENEEALEDMVEEVTSAKIGDCTKEDVLKMPGVGNFDYCFVFYYSGRAENFYTQANCLSFVLFVE